MVQSPPIVVRPTILQNFKATLLRPEDLLYLNFEFINLMLKIGEGKPARLARLDGSRRAYIVVYFPPQHIAEQSFFESSVPQTTAPPIKARITKSSRLVFIVPAEITEIPYTFDALLDWLRYPQSVALTAVVDAAPGVKPNSSRRNRVRKCACHSDRVALSTSAFTQRRWTLASCH